MEEQRSIVIIGGGLSGLTLGTYIKDGGFNSVILEQSERPGGVLQTREKDGYLLEYGANTTSTNLAFDEIISILKLKDQLVEPKADARDRFIVKNNQLKKISPKPKDILFSSLLSPIGKWTLFKEQFVPATVDYQEETVGSFFERRFGKEVVDYIVNPMIGGIYAGDPYQLSMQHVFPKLLDLEQEYGSIIKAVLKERDAIPKRNIVGFKGGMKTLTNAMVNYIGEENILCGTEATKVTPQENGQFSVQLKQGDYDLEINADVVVFATPSYVTAEFLRPISQELANLMQMPYPRLGIVHLGFDTNAIPKPIDGFGFLVPEKENKSFLGAIANSDFLPNRAPEGKILFTLFVGGTRQEHKLEHNPELFIQHAVNEFKEMMNINTEPELQEFHIWENSIPQFQTGHRSILEGFQFFENNIDNIHILGNFRSGVSVADCIQGAKRAHGKLIKDYSRQSYHASRSAKSSQ